MRAVTLISLFVVTILISSGVAIPSRRNTGKIYIDSDSDDGIDIASLAPSDSISCGGLKSNHGPENIPHGKSRNYHPTVPDAPKIPRASNPLNKRRSRNEHDRKRRSSNHIPPAVPDAPRAPTVIQTSEIPQRQFQDNYFIPENEKYYEIPPQYKEEKDGLTKEERDQKKRLASRLNKPIKKSTHPMYQGCNNNLVFFFFISLNLNFIFEIVHNKIGNAYSPEGVHYPRRADTYPSPSQMQDNAYVPPPYQGMPPLGYASPPYQGMPYLGYAPYQGMFINSIIETYLFMFFLNQNLYRPISTT